MRRIRASNKPGEKRFNPRICKRCDDGRPVVGSVFGVSIHASVKDATSRLSGGRSPIYCFNPRICKRCDLTCNSRQPPDGRVSIHASVKDATITICISVNYKCFNPRICKRCDHVEPSVSCWDHVSIHASVKDATVGVFMR